MKPAHFTLTACGGPGVRSTFLVESEADGRPVGMVCFDARAGVWESYYPANGGDLVGRFHSVDSAVARLHGVNAARLLLDVVVPNDLRSGRILP